MPNNVLELVLEQIDQMDFSSWKSAVEPKQTSPVAQQKSKQTGTMGEIVSESNNGRPAATNRVR